MNNVVKKLKNDFKIVYIPTMKIIEENITEYLISKPWDPYYRAFFKQNNKIIIFNHYNYEFDKEKKLEIVLRL